MQIKGRIHVIGVGGCGMCAVAEATLACGYTVTGSDRLLDAATTTPVLQALASAGCRLYQQDGSAISELTTAVVASTAIEEDNPDIQAAREHGVPVLHRTEWLARLIGDRPLLGIAGTSGKSTVTAMVGWILEKAQLNPFVVNGASMPQWESAQHTGHVRIGSQDLWVLELDESDRSLLRFAPRHAVITNQSADHFSLSDTDALFAAFRARVTGDCLAGPWAPEAYRSDISGSSFVHRDISYRLQTLGLHNAENALAATALCASLGIAPEACAAALASFPGIRRRLERYEPAGQIYVFDDYAHNPAKIAAAFDAVLPLANNVTVIWRPHGYGPLRNMLDDFVQVFARLGKNAAPRRRHRLLLLPVYDMGGSAVRDIQSGDLAKRLQPHEVSVYCLATYDEVCAYCAPACMPAGDAVLVMGARDPNLPGLAQSIAAQQQACED